MAVAFDAIYPDVVGTNGSSPLTWTHTATGSNLAVVVGLSQTTGDSTAIGSLSVFYGSAQMTQLGAIVSANQTSNSNAGVARLFGLVNPPTGAQTITVTGSFNYVGGSISFTGVDQTTPFAAAVAAAGDNNSGTNPPTAIVASAADSMVVDVLVYGSTIGGATGTQRWAANLNGNSGAGNAAQSTYAGASSVTAKYNVTARDWWGMVAVSINAATVVIPDQSIAAPWFGM